MKQRYEHIDYPFGVFEAEMRSILVDDDVNKFHNFLSQGEYYLPSSYFYPAVLDLCLEVGAKQCTLHLLHGKLPHGLPSLHNQTVSPWDPLPALFNAIQHLCDPQVIEALLKNCGADMHVNQDVDGLVPLHFLLGDLAKLQRLRTWSPGRPLLELILLLFEEPKARLKLQCAQLLAKDTDSINKIALGFIEHGELVQLAALLLVASEKALAPFSSGDRETIELCTSMECIDSEDINGRSVASIAAAELLEIFEAAGDELTMLYKSMSATNDIEVITQVTEIIHNAAKKVMYKDAVVNFRINVLKSMYGSLGIETDDFPEKFQMGKRSALFLINGVDVGESSGYQSVAKVVCSAKWHLLRGGGGYKHLLPNLWGTRKFSTCSQFRVRESRSRDYVVKLSQYASKEAASSSYCYPSLKAVEGVWKIPVEPVSGPQYAVYEKIKPGGGTRTFSTSSQSAASNWKHSWACPSGRDLAYLAMKLKRGFRLL